MREANGKTIAFSTTGSSTNIAVMSFVDEAEAERWIARHKEVVARD